MLKPVFDNPAVALAPANYRGFIEETEKDLIINALTKANGNKTMAARSLNMQRSVLYKKLERLGVR